MRIDIPCGVALLSLTLTGASLADELYRESHRPQFHFTPERNWMNDPNGMVYFDGEWHLFYQYNPHGDRWGHMSWGHAVSRDLVRWEHLPLALAEEDGVMIFSGSAVVDWNNTSGFGAEGKPPLVAIYTGHRDGRPARQDQRLAFSNDRGRTWTKFAGNPVLDVKMADFRDPKVFWHEGAGHWIMTVALAAEQKVHFYASRNLKEWRYVGEFGPAGAIDGLWECPDLFSLPLAGAAGAKQGEKHEKWVLIVNINPGGPAGGSGCQYFVGDFECDFTAEAVGEFPKAKFTPEPLAPELAEYVPEGKLLTDFEHGYGDWKVEGNAFGAEPARGTLPNQQPVLGFHGDRLVNSFHEGDAGRGALTSPPFAIDAKFISFLIGGGSHDETRVELVVDGKAVRVARGKNRERLAWESWDVSDFKGKEAAIRVIDEHAGGWGHINLDRVLLADEPVRAASESPLWADFGADFYAGVSWSDVPKSDGRRLWLGWMSNWNYANDVPTSPWRSAMSIPRELSLVSTSAGSRLRQAPVAELASLRGAERSFSGGNVAAANRWLREAGVQSGPLELIVTLKIPEGGKAGLSLFASEKQAVLISADRAANRLSIDRTRAGNVAFHPKFACVQSAPLELKGDRLTLHLFLDACSIEVFAGGGKQVLTSLVFPEDEQTGTAFFGEGVEIIEARAWPLASIWNRKKTD